MNYKKSEIASMSNEKINESILQPWCQGGERCKFWKRNCLKQDTKNKKVDVRRN